VHSRNRCFHGNTAMSSVCVVDLHVLYCAVQYYTVLYSTVLIVLCKVLWLLLCCTAALVAAQHSSLIGNILERINSAVLQGTGKGTVHPITGHEGPEEEQSYSSTLSLTSALNGVGGQRHALAALPPGKTRYPLYRRLGGPQGRSGRLRKACPYWDLIPGPSSP
jgi:hypothetical protein